MLIVLVVGCPFHKLDLLLLQDPDVPRIGYGASCTHNSAKRPGISGNKNSQIHSHEPICHTIWVFPSLGFTNLKTRDQLVG